jgi:hypothetical protein
LRYFFLAIALLSALILHALGAAAQCPNPTNSTPNFAPGGNSFGRTADQWNQYFGAKVDATSGVLCGPTIQNLANPANPGDPATKQYVDSVAAPISLKQPVNLATSGTAAFTGSISGTALTVSSVSAGKVGPGQVIVSGSGVTPGTIIVSGSGASWVVSPSQTVSSMTAMSSVATLPPNSYFNGALGSGATLTGLSNGALSVDGTAVTAGMRIGVKDESSPAKNGIYVVTSTGSVSTPYILTRAPDFNIATNIIPNSYFLALAGQINISTGWLMTTPGVIVPGSSPIVFVQFSEATPGLGFTPLNPINNLSDVSNTIVALNNLAPTPSNAALKALTGMTAGMTVQRKGFATPGDGGAATYVFSTTSCSIASGAGDNGSQVKPTSGGGCWLADLSGTRVSPLVWGAVGNGVVDDTAAVQAAITSCGVAGFPLRFDAIHLYNITATLTISLPCDVEGAGYRYGAQAVNQPTGSGSETCTWGLVSKNTGITMIDATAVTGTIRGMCIDMTGNAAVSAGSGAAIMIIPPSITTYSSGWHVELNTILQPYDGIIIPGNGAGAGCCGIGTSADGDAILRNTIVSPGDAAISIGKNSAAIVGGPGTTGITVTDNSIVCKTTASQTSAYGVVIYEGAIWYDGTQNGPQGCHVGTAVIPGTLGGDPQFVSFNGDGVFGSASGLYNLLIQPAAGGTVAPVTIGGKGPQANGTGNTGSILIDGTVGTVEEVAISGIYASAGGSTTHAALDVEGGTLGPFDVNISNSLLCGQGTATATTAIRLSTGSGAAGRWTINGNHVGTGCLAGRTVDTGIQLVINSGSTARGSVTITGNDISGSPAPIAYTPNSDGADNVVIRDNAGVDNVAKSLTAASTVTLINAFDSYTVAGSTTIQTINGAWNGRRIQLTATATGTLNLGTSGNICAGALSGENSAWLEWFPGGSCWAHVSNGVSAVNGVLTTPTINGLATFNGGLSLNPPAGLGIGINQTQTMSGSSASTVLANVLQITSDTAAITGSQNSLQTLNVTDAFGGSTAQGGRHALVGVALLTAPTSPSNAFRDYVGVVGFAQANTGDNGTNLTTNPQGNFFGGSLYYNLLPGATNLGMATGVEVNSFAQATSSVKSKSLIALVAGGTLDQVQGSTWDSMLHISRQVGGVGFQAAITFSDAFGAFPITPSGALIQGYLGSPAAPTNATAADGVELSHVTFTHCSVQFSTSGPYFCGNGASFGGAPLNTGAYLTMLSNVSGVSPPSAATTFSLSVNFNGFRDFDIWNDDTAATQTIAILQKTSGGNVTVMAINNTGTMTLPGATTGTPATYACFDSSNNIIKSATAC